VGVCAEVSRCEDAAQLSSVSSLPALPPPMHTPPLGWPAQQEYAIMSPRADVIIH
jgi:hypothetical protein